jgi:hypothetical protein
MNRNCLVAILVSLASLIMPSSASAQTPGYCIGPLGHVWHRHHRYRQFIAQHPDFWRNAAYFAAGVGHTFVFGGTPFAGAIGGNNGAAPSGGGDVIQNPRQPTSAIELTTPTADFTAHEDDQFRRAGETSAALERIRVEILRMPPRGPAGGASNPPTTPDPTPPPRPNPPPDGGGTIVLPRPPG